MKIAEVVNLINRGDFAASDEWKNISRKIHSAISTAEWPEGSGTFTIHPQSGKKSGEGNGVVPIKTKPMKELCNDGWTLEYPWNVARKEESSKKGTKPGNIDAAKMSSEGLIVIEWETGNISSSHRSINKIALGLLTGKCIAGVLIVPNMNLAKFLTDRIGNIEEIRPYLPMWEALSIENGILDIIVIEQDGESFSSEKIPKGKDGRATKI